MLEYLKFNDFKISESANTTDKLLNNPIWSLKSYNGSLSMSINDKLGFLKKIGSKFDCIVDFGCADGKMLKEISINYPGVKLIGYDLNATMISSARKTLSNKNAMLTDNWEEVVKECKKYKSPLIYLSSVIHEIYSYSNSLYVNRFWKDKVFGGIFKYIAIRDMIPSVMMSKEEEVEFHEDVKKIKQKANKRHLSSFENKWGVIDDNYKTLTHFLLKYRYADDWERELNENYLPVSLETIKSKIPRSYSIIYEDSYILDYIKNKVKEDFDVELKHSTHSKLIIENLSFDKKINEAIIPQKDFKELISRISSISRSSRAGDISLEELASICSEYEIEVVDYETFLNDLPESDKKTAPPRNEVPFFGLLNPVSHKIRIVIGYIKSLNERMIPMFKHILEHESIHVGQQNRRNIQLRLPDPKKRKEYFSNKDEIMAFAQSISDMVLSDPKSTTFEKSISVLRKGNRLLDDIKRDCDSKTVKRYYKYIYQYLYEAFKKV